ncbi:hypothetical protein FGO68_gene5362 [Halteria grandinella]|uniref:Uncharacterized protein n=1 Tax=Halteria grandinella TaxID=5974 RepID=A0A8J8P654_HALGN|nr:hypothetical protein FGO68_gene5362 [Halteria grandinella]
MIPKRVALTDLYLIARLQIESTALFFGRGSICQRVLFCNDEYIVRLVVLVQQLSISALGYIEAIILRTLLQRVVHLKLIILINNDYFLHFH